jgi:hypothetical protein
MPLPKLTGPAGRHRRRISFQIRWRWVFLVLALGLAAFALTVWIRLNAPAEGNPPIVRLQVPRGVSGPQLLTLLEEHGLAPRPTITSEAQTAEKLLGLG